MLINPVLSAVCEEKDSLCNVYILYLDTLLVLSSLSLAGMEH